MPCVSEKTNPPTKKEPKARDPPPPLDSETEDEEVRMNCIAGVHGGFDESDINTMNQSDDEGEDDSDNEDLDNMSSTQGVVTFVTFPSRNKQELIRPIASPAIALRLSPIIENISGSSDDSQIAMPAKALSESEGYAENEVYNYKAGTCDLEVEEQDDDVSVDTRKAELEAGDVLQSFDDNLDSVIDSCGIRFIGLVEDHDDTINVPNVKRVLSFNTLSALNADIGRRDDSLKRPRTDSILESLFRPLTLSDLIIQYPQERPYSHNSSSDEEELDRQLEEELDEYSKARVSPAEDDHDREKTPVPLLTPPGSPLTVVMESGVTTICEWPSNMTVESAMQAVQELRPLSPASLELLEIDEQDRFSSVFGDDISTISTSAAMLQGVTV